MKTEIYNLIILDESGSMECVRRQTIDGCNETINTIRASQEKFAGTQTHFVSIYAFQSNGRRQSRYVMKNQPVGNVPDITADDYEPWGMTPLYDAVGSTLSDLKAAVAGAEMAIGSVTIITDGAENSSQDYDLRKVADMIAKLKEKGWSFNFIGANIDVERTAASLNIDNSLEFQQDEEGTRAMFEQERNSRMAYHSRLNEAMAESCCGCEPEESRLQRMRDAAKNYFKKR